MPESLLRPAPLQDGARLLEQVEGVEGQVWRGGDLLATQWWPTAPEPAVWHRFLRAASLAPDAQASRPAPAAVGWGRPWARVRGGGAASDRVEAIAWRAAAVAIAAVLGWQMAARDAERAALAALGSRIEALRTQAMPLLDARERADRARADVERYRTLQRGTSDYSLMAAVAVPLGRDARLLSWHRQGEQLKVRVTSATTDPRDYVRAYERMGLLSDAQASPALPEGMNLEFRLPDGFKAGTAE